MLWRCVILNDLNNNLLDDALTTIDYCLLKDLIIISWLFMLYQNCQTSVYTFSMKIKEERRPCISINFFLWPVLMNSWGEGTSSFLGMDSRRVWIWTHLYISPPLLLGLIRCHCLPLCFWLTFHRRHGIDAIKFLCCSSDNCGLNKPL